MQNDSESFLKRVFPMDIKLLLAKALKKILNPPALRNCFIDTTARVCSKSELNNVTLGKYSYIGNDCFMGNVEIGAFCSIADRVCIGGAGHPIERVSSSPVFHEGTNVIGQNFQFFPYEHTPMTTIENDVWIGIGSIIKAGVTICNGAVIGAGSVVTHDVPAYEIWAGNPARKIRNRFDKETGERIVRTEWWNKSDKEIKNLSKQFDDVSSFIGGHE